jgi:DNA-binding Lrp family transcriptional regulator
MECHVITGEIDYFMIVRIRDSESINSLHAEQLTRVTRQAFAYPWANPCRAGSR